ALNVPGPRGTGSGVGPRSGPCSSAHHCGQAGIKRFFDLLRADVVDVNVNPSGSNDFAFAGNHLSSWSDHYVDVRLHIRIASFADGSNVSVLDGDIGLHNAPMVQDHCVGNNRINCALPASTLRLSHAITNDLPASKLDLLAISREVLLWLDNEIGIREAY